MCEDGRVAHEVSIGRDTPGAQSLKRGVELLSVNVPADEVELAKALAAELPCTLVNDGVEELVLVAGDAVDVSCHVVSIVGALGEGTGAHFCQLSLGKCRRTVELVFSFGKHKKHVGVTHKRPVDAGTLRGSGTQFLCGKATVPFAYVKCEG